MILNKLEQRGTIIIQDRWINYTDSYFLSHWLGWVIAAIITALYPVSVLYKRITARGTHIAQVNPVIFAIRAVGLAVIAFGIVGDLESRAGDQDEARPAARGRDRRRLPHPADVPRDAGRRSAATSTPSAATPRLRAEPASTFRASACSSS